MRQELVVRDVGTPDGATQLGDATAEGGDVLVRGLRSVGELLEAEIRADARSELLDEEPSSEGVVGREVDLSVQLAIDPGGCFSTEATLECRALDFIGLAGKVDVHLGAEDRDLLLFLAVEDRGLDVERGAHRRRGDLSLLRNVRSWCWGVRDRCFFLGIGFSGLGCFVDSYVGGWFRGRFRSRFRSRRGRQF